MTVVRYIHRNPIKAGIVTRLEEYPWSSYDQIRKAYQGNGIGTALLKEIEKDNSKLRQELFTSDQSLRNLRLYKRLGFVQFKTKPLSEDLNLVFMEKEPGLRKT